METIKELLTILAAAMSEGRNVTIKADEITIKGGDVTMSAAEILVE